MNNQEFFDKTIAHLRKQKVRSVTNRNAGGATCAYRGERQPDGTQLMCAVGVHIPDAFMKTHMHSNSEAISSLLISYDEIEELFEGVSSNLMRDMQSLHDDADECGAYATFEGEAFEARAETLASDFNLKYTPPEQA